MTGTSTQHVIFLPWDTRYSVATLGMSAEPHIRPDQHKLKGQLRNTRKREVLKEGFPPQGTS